ncbi:MAG: MvaI/BcnI family restriction endonuclease [Parabacteroides sp.]
MVNMRPFTTFEQENLKFLVNHNVKFTQVEVTPTGLGKGILDATAPMRTYFLEEGIHDYENQKQGPAFKVIRKAVILTEDGQCVTQASFYRPVTKKGDPRMWIYKLSSYATGNDIYALIHFEDVLYAINITQVNIEKCYHAAVKTPMQEVLAALYHQSMAVSDELLHKFRSVSEQWFESEVYADTGIGRTIESFLGIRMNSDQTPDYKGIELKSHREKRSSKKNVLFTQTPDWNLSALKSGKESVVYVI